MVKYRYDAWGTCKVLNASGTEITDANHIGNLNSFRYRSYYYDTEIKLYFLQSRYYDPEVGRFITIDDISYLDPDSINGMNLYAYCKNNPVAYIDPDGNFAITTAIIIGLIAGAIIGGTIGGVTAYNMAQEIGITGWELAGYTALGVFGGAVLGGMIGAGIGAGIGGLITSATALLSSFGGGGLLALAGGGITGGSLALVGVSVGATVKIGVAAGVLGVGIAMFSKPNSGRIRFSDGTGKNPATGKDFTDENLARDYYKTIKDPVEKAKWKKWLKGKGWYHNHLKEFILIPLIGEWLRRMFTGDW